MDIKSLLSLTRELMVGNYQAFLESKDIFEENEVPSIKYFTYFSFLERDNYEDYNKIDINFVCFNKKESLEAFLKNLDDMNDIKDVFVNENKDVLVYRLYRHFLSEDCDVIINNRTQQYLIAWNAYDSDFYQNQILKLNDWLLNNISSKNLLIERVLEDNQNQISVITYSFNQSE